MFNQNYDDYFRNSLNYPPEMFNTYGLDNNNYPDYYGRVDYMMNGYAGGGYNIPRNSQTTMMNQNNENLYPDIYKVVYPMVVKICSNNTRAVTEDLVSEMTDTIYNNIESEDFFENDTRQKTEPELKKGDVRNSNAKLAVTEIKEDRQRRPNPTLRALIRILILRELFGNPPRPPRPRPPYRPGMPGGNMPPMMPRESYQDMYY